MSRKGIQFTDRDKKILCFLFEQKVVLEFDIRERFFTEKGRTTCTNRLRRLLEGQFIEKRGLSPVGRLKSYFFLTENGLNAIKGHYSFEMDKIRYKSDSILHDLDLTVVRRWLEKREMLQSFYSENFLQNCFLDEYFEKLLPLRKVNADAGLRLKNKSGEFFVSLEYEKSLKNPSRYLKKFTDYYFDSSITAVFYICSNEEVKRTIGRIDKTACQGFKSKIFISTIEKVQNCNEFIPFINSKGDTFRLY